MKCPADVPCRNPGECQWHRRHGHFDCLRTEIDVNVTTHLSRKSARFVVPRLPFEQLVLGEPSDESANLEAA